MQGRIRYLHVTNARENTVLTCGKRKGEYSTYIWQMQARILYLRLTGKRKGEYGQTPEDSLRIPVDDLSDPHPRPKVG